MDMYRWFLCFTLFGFIGWAYESVYYTIQQRKLVNSGFLNGCICPIYGVGGLLILIFLGGIEKPVHIFLLGMILTCSLEYFVSWLLEKLFKKRWWDYTGWPLNINGRICMLGGCAFGLMAVAEVKYIAPAAFYFTGLFSDNVLRIACAIISLLILIDLITTVRNSEKFTDKLWYVREQAEIFTEDGIGGKMISAVTQRLPGSRMNHSDEDYIGSTEERKSIIERIKEILHIK